MKKEKKKKRNRRRNSVSTTEARKKDRFSSSCRKFAAWRASRKPKWNQNQLQSQVLIQFHSFRVHDLWWSIFKNIHFRDDDTKCYHFSFLSSILNSILCDFWTIRSTRALRARRKGSRKKKKCIKKRERRKRRIFVESARLEAASVPISVRSCDGISEKRFTQRDRTRGDGLAEISLENSTIAHLPALIRSPPMVLWLIEWGIFNFRSTLPLTPSACTPPPVFARRHPHHHPHTRASAALIRVCVCVCVCVFASTATLARPFTPTRAKPPKPLPPSPLIYPFPIRLPTTELPLLLRGTMFAFCGTLRPCLSSSATLSFLLSYRLVVSSPPLCLFGGTMCRLATLPDLFICEIFVEFSLQLYS